MKRSIVPSLFALLLLSACDADDSTVALAAEVDRLQAENDALRAAARLSVAAPVDLPAQDGPEFRGQYNPWQKVIPAAESQDTISKIMAVCGAYPITISTAGYELSLTNADEQVLSLAYSYIGTLKARKCLEDEMDARGAIDL